MNPRPVTSWRAGAHKRRATGWLETQLTISGQQQPKGEGSLGLGKKEVVGLGAAAVVAFSINGAGDSPASAMGAFDQAVGNSVLLAAITGGLEQQAASDASGALAKETLLSFA